MPFTDEPFAPHTGRRRDLLALILVVLVAGLPRVIVLDADPPARVLGPTLTDEGWWAQNARQRVLFGKWVMDERNPGLYAAPAYTAALAATYAVAGLGLAQTRLLSALSGALACGLLYLGLRAVMPRRSALLPALLLALGSFAILSSRVALVESMQLAFAVLALAGVLGATRYPALGAIGGLGFVGALLTKPDAVILGPVFAVAWLLDYRDRRRAHAEIRPLLRQVFAFAAAVACGAIVVAALFVWPNWDPIRQQLGVSLANAYATSRRLGQGGTLVMMLPMLSVRPSLLFLESPIPLAGLILLAWRRLVHQAGLPLDPVERLAWVWWWGVLAFIALQDYQPDRRFLLLVPALAILGARGLFESIPVAATGPASVSRSRGALAGALGGIIIGLFLMHYGAPPLMRLSSGLAVGGQRGISGVTLRLLVWNGTVVAGALLGAWLARRPALWTRRVPAEGWALLFVLTEPVSVVRDLMRPSFSERDASRAIAQVARALPPDQRVMTGWLANSLALESDIFAFYIRDEPEVGARMNLDGWERFHPTMAVTAAVDGARVGMPLDPASHGLMPLCRLLLWSRTPKPQPIEVTLWFTPDHRPAPTCPPPAQPAR